MEDKENVSHVMVNEYSRDLLTLCEFEILDQKVAYIVTISSDFSSLIIFFMWDNY